MQNFKKNSASRLKCIGYNNKPGSGLGTFVCSPITAVHKTADYLCLHLPELHARTTSTRSFHTEKKREDFQVVETRSVLRDGMVPDNNKIDVLAGLLEVRGS